MQIFLLYDLLTDHALYLLSPDGLILLPVNLQAVLVSLAAAAEGLLAEQSLDKHTLQTNLRLLVNLQTVPVPVLSVSERLPTGDKRTLLLSVDSPLVTLQEVGVSKLLLTRLAIEQELILRDVSLEELRVISVDLLLVLLHLVFSPELSVAQLALVRSLLAVGRHVLLQIVILEHFLTDFAGGQEFDVRNLVVGMLVSI